MFPNHGLGAVLGGAARLREAIASITLAGNNTTESKTVFTVTGVVLVTGIWGEVTTALGSNHTAAHLRLNDQTATVDITLATGVTLSSYEAGSLILKEGLVAAALTGKRANAGFFEEGGAAGFTSLSAFIVGKKSSAATTIDYRYTTTNTPTSGVIKWHALWLPLSSGGNLA